VTVNVIRGFTQTPGSATLLLDHDGVGINPYLKVIGSAYEEGSAAPDPISFDPEELFNQTQIWRATYGITGTAAKTRTRTGDEVRELKRECLENFSMDMEMGLWFGKKTTTIRNGQPLRTTNGVLSFIPQSNVKVAAGGILTLGQLEAWIGDMFRYGATEKMAFCGAGFLTAVNQMIRANGDGGSYTLSATTKEYGGFDVRRLNFGQGTLVLKAHPIFSQMTGGTTGGTAFTSMNNSAVVLDMGNLKYRYLRDRDVKYQTDLQERGIDGLLAGYIGEAGLEVHHPYTHFMIQGVASGGAG
jgi:hypothetical protein